MLVPKLIGKRISYRLILQGLWAVPEASKSRELGLAV